uniref:Uncharacterized protein n=1 Tax=Leersia perrieri TaxID=77586 RepID=A0A0D9XUM1_9ORYZ
MEKGSSVGDDPVRSIGMCDRVLTFLAKNLSMNRQKNITEGPRNGINNGGHVEEEVKEVKEDEDEFTIEIEKAEFEFFHDDEEDDQKKNITATILDVVTTNAEDENVQKEGEEEEAAHQKDHPPVVAPVPEKKVKKTVTIKEESKEESGGASASASTSSAVKRLLSKKRQASSSQLGGEEEKQKPPAARRSGLRPRMPSILRVPSNINERSSNFIEERKRSFGSGGAGAAGGKPEK